MALAKISNLGPFHNRPEEWELYQPLVGSTMLELGNKRNDVFTYKNFFASLGYKHVSVDWNGEDGALKMDLRQPLNLGTFDMVTNIGVSEHVEDQHGVWKNIVDACGQWTVLLCTTPAPGQWPWHGIWYPDDTFYKELARLNGFVVDRLYESGEDPRVNWFARMTRTRRCEFQMPAVGMFKNA